MDISGTGYGGSPAGGLPESHGRLAAYILRGLVISLTFIATLVMGVAKQSFSSFQITVKSTQSSSFVYFIAANVFVCVYSAVAAGLSFTSSSTGSFELPLAVADLVALAFLFTSNAASMAIDVVARKGIANFGWDKICNVAGTFCGHVTAAIVLSSLATIACVLLLVTSIVTIHRKSLY
ncbi:hypothetical protein KSP39_PZI007456 [Platanthera zijinensis]|uniref:CASP-like protein n=1 Tax=Platanthera zijinensis TaxID=2320716 RepID=A0AAP0BQG3_9ASPA